MSEYVRILNFLYWGWNIVRDSIRKSIILYIPGSSLNETISRQIFEGDVHFNVKIFHGPINVQCLYGRVIQRRHIVVLESNE